MWEILIVEFVVPANHRVKLIKKKKGKKWGKYLDLAREKKKKTMDNEIDCDYDCCWCAHYSH